MASTMIDSEIFRDLFGTEAMREIFSDQAMVGHYLDVEAALARVQAKIGLIPEAAAAEITAKAKLDIVDWPRMKSRTDVVGYPIVALVEIIVAACDDGLGEYAHWGATTQDIMDTALALQLKAAHAILGAELAKLSTSLATLARDHRDTPMAGRTHLQQALPLTFGYKAAVWLAANERHRTRLNELNPRVAVGQFSGAVGTLASLSADGLAVQEGLMAELDLGVPDITWHAARDGVAEAVNFLALATGSLAKIATDVMLMMQSEIGEAFEPYQPGRGASSTMPQKRNPIACEFIIMGARAVRQYAAMTLDGMIADHERATGPWQLEWLAVPQAYIITAGALAHANDMLAGLEVNVDGMRRNLGLTQGLIVSEAVMMGLAPTMGRQRAHDVVYDCCRAAALSGRPLLDHLLEEPDIAAQMGRDGLAALCDPGNYTGQAGEMVDRVLARL